MPFFKGCRQMIFRSRPKYQGTINRRIVFEIEIIFRFMAILAFQKPDKVIMIESDDKVGKFEFRPLEPGYGITIGNALRRILLSSLEGYAITTIKIEGVEHEFSTIPGVIEEEKYRDALRSMKLVFLDCGTLDEVDGLVSKY